jgi:hypothetical protein
MLLPRSLVLAISALGGTISAVNLFVSHFSGNIVTLSLTANGGSYSLTQSSTLSVGGQPSWITYDPSTRTIYVSDEMGYQSAYLTALSASSSGVLSVSGKTTNITFGAVASGLYGGGNFIANAH